MVYMGSKAKYANEIVPILQRIIEEYNITSYIEPFVGGANIIDKIQCANKYGYDKNATVIALHQQAQEDISIIPAHGDRDWWDDAKNIYRAAEGSLEQMSQSTMELWRIGAIAFLGSFSNGGFSRGYAKNKDGRDYYNEAYNNLQKQAENPLYKAIKFQAVEDYSDILIPPNSLVYCDPPYQNTKPYGYKFETAFDYTKYWNWIRNISANNYVVCSEQVFPEDFDIIWEQKATRTCGKDNTFKAVEKLGIYTKGISKGQV